MKLLVIREKNSDFIEVLESCNAEVDKMTMMEAANTDISKYDAYCILLPNMSMNARLHHKVEEENKKGINNIFFNFN